MIRLTAKQAWESRFWMLLVGSDRWKLSNPTGASGEPLLYIFNCVLKSVSVLCEYQACALLEEPSLQMAALEDLADLR